MSLFDELGIPDPSKINLKDEAERFANGGLCPKGVHQAMLTGASDLIIQNAKRGYKLIFEVMAGPGKGASIEEVLWLPKGENEAADKKVRTRGLLFAKRLGLIRGVIHGAWEIPDMVPGKNDYCDCRGALCFVDVTHEDETYEKDGHARTIKKAKLTFEGVLDPGDKKCKDVPKVAGSPVQVGAPAPTHQTAIPPATAPRDLLGDI